MIFLAKASFFLNFSMFAHSNIVSIHVIMMVVIGADITIWKKLFFLSRKLSLKSTGRILENAQKLSKKWVSGRKGKATDP